MEKYSKMADNVCPNYVTYYRFGKSVHHTFNVRYNSKNEIDGLMAMDKRINNDGNWYVNGENGNITKEEFDAELFKAILFLTDKQQNIDGIQEI